jgi:hypothetical protein
MNRDAVGATGEPFEIHVERGKIRELARALFSSNPAYLQDEPPSAPPTFFTTMYAWEHEYSSPWFRFELDQKRALHASQEFEFFGPPPVAGTRLTGRSRIDDIFEKQGSRGGKLVFGVMITEFRDDAGTLVAQAKVTVVETERPPTEASS